MSVLLVEDNEDDIELTRRAFEKAGLAEELHVAQDGAEATEKLFKSPAAFQLVLLDLNLPKEPGLHVLRRIRLNPDTRTIPVVILTVSRKEPDLLQSFTMGISDYLIKPLDPGRVTEIYRKHVRGPVA